VAPDLRGGRNFPGTVKNQLFAALDWLPTFVDIAGGPKGDGLKKEIEAGKYPGIHSTALTSATTWRASPTNRRAMSSSISRARPHPRCATRTGRCITICRSLGQRAGSCRSPGSTSPSSEHKTRSLRTGCRRKPEDGQRHWGALGGPLTAFRTETLTAIR
jgi:hypothetical protein